MTPGAWCDPGLPGSGFTGPSPRKATVLCSSRVEVFSTCHSIRSLMANFMCALVGLRDAHKADETVSLGLSMRVSLEEISILISRLGWESCQGGGHHLITKGLNRRKPKRKGKFTLCLN